MTVEVPPSQPLVNNSNKQVMLLTEEVRQPIWLVVVYYSNTQSVESYQTEDCPVKGLSFDNSTDIETQPLLLFVKGSGVFQLGTFDAGSSKG